MGVRGQCRHHRLQVIAAVFALAVLTAPAAPCQPTPLRRSPIDPNGARDDHALQYVPEAGCPTRQWLTERIEEFLGRTFELRGTSRVRVHLRRSTAQGPEGFEAELRWRLDDRDDQRRLTDPDCTVLADASAFIIASALDPLATYQRARPLEQARVSASIETPQPDSDVPSGKAPEPERTTKPNRQATPEHVPPSTEAYDHRGAAPDEAARSLSTVPTHAFLGPAIDVRAGLSPDPILGFGLSAHLQVARFWTALGATVGVPQRSTPAGRGVELTPVVGTLDICVLLTQSQLLWPLCARVEAGAVRGEGLGVSDPTLAWLPWVGAGISTGFALDVAPNWRVSSGVGVVTPIARPRFLLSEAPIYEARRLAVTGSVGAQWRFW